MGYLYSKWDGAQGSGALHSGQLMDELAEHLLTSADLSQALRSLLQRGLRSPSGDRVPGIQDLLEKLRQRRQQALAQYNLEAAVDDLRQQLDRVLATERGGIERRLQEARQRAEDAGQAPGPISIEEAQQLLELLERLSAQHRSDLDALPRDLGGAVKGLSGYDFMDGQARAQFDALLQLLQQKMLESHLKDLAQRFRGLNPQESQRLREMLEQLNGMLEQRLRGLEPDLHPFLDRFGAALGGHPPASLDELAQQLRHQMSQLQSLLNSLPQQLRESLQQMLDASIPDQDLRAELARLAANLEGLLPLRGNPSEYLFTGEEPVTLEEALRLMERLQGLDTLERQLNRARQSGNLREVDQKGLGQLLGAEAGQDLAQLERLTGLLEESGYIQKLKNGYELTPRGVRRIGQRALQDIFAYIKKDRWGKHSSRQPGQAGDQEDDTKGYEFGDPFRLHLERTFMNSLLREVGLPVRLEPSDFEVYRGQHLSQCATVLMLDLSLSMAMKGSFLAAKKVALALNDLMRSQFPRDRLYIVGFSTYARELKAASLPYLSWDEFDPYTNMQHGFALSQKLLSKDRSSNKQIIMISDGEPTAHMEAGRLYLGYPPSPHTLEQTLREVKRCTQQGITINTFMLDRSAYLVEFVSQLTKVNRGRVFYTSPEKLGQYLLVDYLSDRRHRVAG